MARSKLKKKKNVPKKFIDEDSSERTKIPIPDLPDKFVWMKVKSSTKIRNVLEYGLKEFSGKDGSIVWSGAGQGIGKTITCAEIFKRKISGLHQITKLRYVKSNSSSENESNSKKDRTVPQIHILLSRRVLDAKEPGYQAPGVCSMFQNPKFRDNVATKEGQTRSNEGQTTTRTRMPEETAEEFASMGLRTGQKRPRQNQGSSTSTKKSKRIVEGNE